MSDIISYSLRSTFAKEFYQSLTDPNSDDSYYMFFGRSKPWDGDVPAVVDTIKEQNEAKRNILFYQKIIPSDVSLVAPRYNWQSGIVYDQYEDDVSLWSEGRKFYVLVEDVDDYRVYICLSNNSGEPSTSVPNGESVEEIYTSDGYIWKYMYTFTNEMKSFLTNDFIPVLILDKLSYSDSRALALNVKANATNGMLEKITINSSGDSFQDLVNHQFTDSEYKVTTVNSLSFTASLRSQMSSTTGYYNTNYIVYFENGNIGTVDTYINNGDGTVTITLCELYPGSPEIAVEDVFSIIPKVNIKGNGTGAIAVPIFDSNNNLIDINLISGGQNYNFAESYFLTNTEASISPVIPPDGGFGFYFAGEIKPTNILIRKEVSFGSIPDDQEKYFGAGSYIRQIGIVKNVVSNEGESVDQQTEQYDMVLKYGGVVEGTNYYSFFNDSFSLPAFRTKTLISGSNNSLDVFFEAGYTYRAKDVSVPPNIWEGKYIEKIGNYYIFAQTSVSGQLSTTNVTTIENVEKQTSSAINNFDRYLGYFDLNIKNNIQQTDVYLTISNFDNSTGFLYGAFNQVYPPSPVFFEVNDVINVPDIGKFRITEIIRPGFSSVAPFVGTALPQGKTGTTFKVSIINILDSFLDYNYITDAPNTLPTPFEFIENITKGFSLDLLAMGNFFFSGPQNYIFFKDKVSYNEVAFNSSLISFSQPSTAPTTAPTHILGNDSLAAATIESLTVDPVNNDKINLKISRPTDDFEQAVVSNGSVISGESVSLLKATPRSFTRSLEKVGNTDTLYVLSENFDISNPANIPTTITSSVVSKITVKRTGNTVLNNNIIPVGSYIFREGTDLVDDAAAYVVSVDEKTISGSDSFMNIYVQMEKGSFSVNDVIKCVQDPFTKNVSLFNALCAGNSGVNITVSDTEKRYNNIFLNKYSGEVLHIQNTANPIQLSTDSNFTTRILLGF